jgi:hypothetical protein
MLQVLDMIMDLQHRKYTAVYHNTAGHGSTLRQKQHPTQYVTMNTIEKIQTIEAMIKIHVNRLDKNRNI